MSEPAIYFDTNHDDDRAFGDDLDRLAADRGIRRWSGESDSELRDRIVAGLYQRRGTLGQIEQALLEINGVRRVNIIEEHDALSNPRLVVHVHADTPPYARHAYRDLLLRELWRTVAAGVTWVLELEYEERDRTEIGFDGIARGWR